jgi:prevent-host-death family protein
MKTLAESGLRSHNVTMASRSITAARFKAQCLALLDEVAETRQPLTVTKRGKPVATLVPAVGLHRQGSLRGSVKVKGDIVGPVLESWDLDA